MKNIRQWMMTALGCALLAACGGGDPTIPGSGSPAGAPTTKGNFTSLVVFGDSLSDIGTYAPVTSATGNGQPPYIGGKFTTNGGTNGANGTVWVENLATSLGLTITPAEVGGFGIPSVKCPAALANPALANTCTGYAQGGSRITDINGIGHSGGALTVPVVTQIANHLARFSSFKATDLVVVFGGNNDVFTQFGAFTTAATQIQTDAATGKITVDEANRRLFQAQTQAQTAMKQAAQELAGYVRSQILAKGAKYVVVWNLPDSALTPFGASLKANPATAGVVPVLSGLVDIFNLWLRDGLTDQPVQLVDANTQFKDAYNNPSKYGMVNNTTPACDAAKISLITGGFITDGSSLFCNSTPGAPFNGLTAGADVTTWQFADSVHPTTGGHKLISDVATQILRSYGWI
jgi:phospholipase/lecithinase/hemolysin